MHRRDPVGGRLKGLQLRVGGLERTEIRAMADPPRGDPIFVALAAYKARFGDVPTVMGILSALFPELAAELRAAIADGRKRTDAEIRRAVGMALPPPSAEI